MCSEKSECSKLEISRRDSPAAQTCLQSLKGRQLSWAGHGLPKDLAKHVRGPGSSGGPTPQRWAHRTKHNSSRGETGLRWSFGLPRTPGPALPPAALALPVTEGFLGPWNQGQLKALLSPARGSGMFWAVGPLRSQGWEDKTTSVRTLALATPFLGHPRACLCHSVKEQDTPGLVASAAPQDWPGDPQV